MLAIADIAIFAFIISLAADIFATFSFDCHFAIFHYYAFPVFCFTPDILRHWPASRYAAGHITLIH